MRLVFAPAAQRELAEAIAYIALDDPQAAERLDATIRAAAARLTIFPKLGVRARGQQRRLPVAGTPYLIVYRVTRDAIIILRVWHGARQWPPASR